MPSNMHRHMLQEFALTEVCREGDEGAVKILLQDGSHYFHRPKMLPTETIRRDGKPNWAPREFSVYPLVFKANGSPWDEANCWLLNVLEQKYDANMSTYRGKAEDLQHFRNFIDSRDIDWLVFPKQKLLRPTYRYRGFLRVEIEVGGMARSTASRRQSSVVQFYRWLIERKLFTPEYPQWVEGEAYIPVQDQFGRSRVINRRTTDVNISVGKNDNPYDPRIDDGGKLRPLSAKEQGWILEELVRLGNTEQTLIQIFALSTGARIQTVLTLRKRHVLAATEGHYDLLCGPGTGIDTKNDRRLTLRVPSWLMDALRTYAVSERATNRRKKAAGGDGDDQYLFLTERCAPMYQSKQSQLFNDGRKRRHVKNGQAVRAYMTQYIIKNINTRHDAHFSYQFHDLRASYGLNLVDEFKPKMNSGELTYAKVLSHVQARMCHKSPTVTERYLRYREDRNLFDSAQDSWEERMERAISAMRGSSE